MENYGAAGQPQRQGNDNVAILQGQVNEVKGVMMSNIEKVIQRGEDLETLSKNAEDLEANSEAFKTNSHRLRKKMWWQNKKMCIYLSVGVVILLLIIIVPIAVKYS